MRKRGFEVVRGYVGAEIKLPTRKTGCSAGYDLEAATGVSIPSGQTVMAPTGLKAYMQPDEVLKIYLRSSVALKLGLALANEVGVVDADYYDNPDNEGHIHVLLLNRTDKPVTIEKGQRIAQGIFQKYLTTDDDEASGEREGGFGSTDN